MHRQYHPVELVTGAQQVYQGIFCLALDRGDILFGRHQLTQLWILGGLALVVFDGIYPQCRHLVVTQVLAGLQVHQAHLKAAEQFLHLSPTMLTGFV